LGTGDSTKAEAHGPPCFETGVSVDDGGDDYGERRGRRKPGSWAGWRPLSEVEGLRVRCSPLVNRSRRPLSSTGGITPSNRNGAKIRQLRMTSFVASFVASFVEPAMREPLATPTKLATKLATKRVKRLILAPFPSNRSRWGRCVLFRPSGRCLMVALTLIPASAMLFPMTSLRQTGFGMLSACVGRGRPGGDGKRFLIS